MDLSNTVNVVFSVVAVISAGISTLLLGSLKTLRDSNADLRSRVGDLEATNHLLTAEVAQAKADRDAFARAARGDDTLEALVTNLDAHHRDSLAHWRIAEGLLEQVIARLDTAS